MNEYIPTIGLEIHAELKTRTKMFCACKNDSDEKRPNVNICPICMAHPGTLPAVNKEAVRHIVNIGRAVGGEVADFTEFDRKNYFYPDIPKGYQISQYEYPIVKGGALAGVALTRVHLEEDTARSTHDKGDHSLIDFNRAGVPLMELVTEPVITSAEEASAFAKELQLLLRHLGASEANMEKGEMRVEANISVARISADVQRMTADKTLLYEELTYKLRGAAFAVYNALGSGHKESIYQNAFAEELRRNSVPFEKEKDIPVSYADKKMGSYHPDFLVDEKIIIELKALPFIGGVEKEQMRQYLKNSPYRLGLLINFGGSPIQIERIVFDSIRDNPSIYPRSSAMGTKVEVKNLNSFKVVEKAIRYEIARHIEVLDGGGKIAQETRGWDEKKETTFSQREKESSHDYRYFPDPDLPKFKLSEVEFKEINTESLEQYRNKLSNFGFHPEIIEIYLRNPFLRSFFDAYARIETDAELLKFGSNYIVTDLNALTNVLPGSRQLGKITISNFKTLMEMTKKGDLSSHGGKVILKKLFFEGGDPREHAEELKLLQKSDEGALTAIAEKVIVGNPKAVAEFKAGKEASLKFLVGQGMKESKGSANPRVFEGILRRLLS